MSVESHARRRATEAVIVCMTLVPLFRLLDVVGVMAWQQANLPYPFFTEIGVLVVLPIAVTLLAGRNLAREGMAIAASSMPRALALPVAAFTWLSTLAFLPLPRLGETYATAMGAAILAVAFGAGGIGMLASLRGLPAVARSPLGNGISTLRVLGVVTAGVVGVVLAAEEAPLVARLFANVLLTAFCEEYFFRGYVQGCCDTAWERRWAWWGVSIGPGLFISACLFGGFHLVPFLATARPVPWAWATWTTVFGLFAGLLRAKTGSMSLPWVMHGALLATRAFGSS